jgi:hypothetical protein
MLIFININIYLFFPVPELDEKKPFLPSATRGRQIE